MNAKHIIGNVQFFMWSNLMKKGFTLSEVMLVLSVIGVIAALTIPGLVQNLNDKQNIVMWKKDYSEVSQSLRMIQDEYGSFDTFLHSAGSMKPALMKYMTNLQDCHNGAMACLQASNFGYKDLSGAAADIRYYCDEGQFIMNNGGFLCTENDGTNGTFIWIDVNGHDKGPNVVGKDFFAIQLIDKDRFGPVGVAGTVKYFYAGGTAENTCNTTSGTYSGWGCGAEYLSK